MRKGVRERSVPRTRRTGKVAAGWGGNALAPNLPPPTTTTTTHAAECSFLNWTRSTAAARRLTAKFVELNCGAFPALAAELRATAAGAGVDADDLIVANLATEIGCVAGP